MNGPPIGRNLPCPSCENTAWAIIPEEGELVEEEENVDGKVWVDCRECGERFLAYYRTK